MFLEDGRENVDTIGGRGERQPCCEFSMGSGHEEGPPRKFVFPSMAGIHPDARNINNLSFLFPEQSRHLNEVNIYHEHR